MPCLRNPNHENAAQHLARRQHLTAEQRLDFGLGEQATLQEEAAALGGLDTGGKSFKANARKFCQRTISKRVAEIQHVAANVASVSVVKLSEQTDEIRRGAIADHEWAAARACIETIAKLNGLWRDKLALTDPSGQQPITPVVVEVVRFADGSSPRPAAP